MLVGWTATGSLVPTAAFFESLQARRTFIAPMLGRIPRRILARYSALFEMLSSTNAASHESTSSRFGPSRRMINPGQREIVVMSGAGLPVQLDRIQHPNGRTFRPLTGLAPSVIDGEQQRNQEALCPVEQTGRHSDVPR